MKWNLVFMTLPRHHYFRTQLFFVSSYNLHWLHMITIQMIFQTAIFFKIKISSKYF